MTGTRAELVDLRQRVGAAVEARRQERGIGVVALARAAHVDKSQMVKILHGTEGTSIASLERIAIALGMASLAEMLMAVGPPRAAPSRRRRKAA